jgi:hypothetical protein
MPTLRIDLQADSRKLEGQMASAGQQAAKKFNSSWGSNNMVGNTLLSKLSGVGSSLANTFARLFGLVGLTAGNEFGKSFKKSGFGQTILGGILGGRVGSNSIISGVASTRFGGNILAQKLYHTAQKTGTKLDTGELDFLRKSSSGKAKGTTSGIEGTTKKAGEGLESFAAGLGLSTRMLGILGLAGALGILTKRTMDYADTLYKQSKISGYSTETLQAFHLLAESVGYTAEDMDALNASIIESRRHALMATDPMNADVQRWKRLGIERAELQATRMPISLLARTAYEKSDKDDLNLRNLIPPNLVPLFKALQEKLKDVAGTTQTMKDQGKLIDPLDIIAVQDVKIEFALLIKQLQTEFAPTVAGVISFFSELFGEMMALKDSLWELIIAIPSIAKIIKDTFIDIFTLIGKNAISLFKLIVGVSTGTLNPIKAMKTLLGMGSGAGQIGKATLGDLGELWDKAAKVVQEKSWKRTTENADRRAALRKAQENKLPFGHVGAAPPIDLQSALTEFAQETKRVPSDEHISIGNFLNTGTSLASIGQQQLSVQQEQLSNLIYLVDLIEQLNNFIGNAPTTNAVTP